MTVRDWASITANTLRQEPLPDALRRIARNTRESAVSRALGYYVRREPTLIWERDWDVCCVLDACRVDLIGEVGGQYEFLPGRVPSIWSAGSASPEWYGNTFAPEHADEFADVGVITANPFSAKPAHRAAGAPEGSLPLTEDRVAYLDEAWRDAWGAGELSTVTPRVLTERAIHAWRHREDLGFDRLIVHYMQPHIPFRAYPEWFGVRENLETFGEPGEEGGTDPWHRARDGDLDRDEFWAAYRDNLRWVLDDIQVLRENCAGEIVLTSDHGNGFGEWGVWSHPPGSAVPALRNVPWVTVSGVDTRSLEGNPRGQSGEDVGADGVNQRLEALGYL